MNEDRSRTVRRRSLSAIANGQIKLITDALVAKEVDPVICGRVDLQCRANVVVAMPAKTFLFVPVHAGQTAPEQVPVGSRAGTERTQVLEYQPGVGSRFATAYGHGHAQCVCGRERLQGLRFCLETTQ